MKYVMLIAVAGLLTACGSVKTEDGFHNPVDAFGYSQMNNHNDAKLARGRHDVNELTSLYRLREGMSKAAVREALGDSPQKTSGFWAKEWQYNTHFVQAGHNNICQTKLTFEKGVVKALEFKNVNANKTGLTVDVCEPSSPITVKETVIVREIVPATPLKIRQ